ncbi:MAG: hypothetical protein HY591_07260 [Candidatus Omnitrophica bacterium]|nr:hypothetical protein [Candidatus Omnitrophota bacterium]
MEDKGIRFLFDSAVIWFYPFHHLGNKDIEGEQMSRVVVLGAGSSKDCGLPLGQEVFNDFEHNGGPAWYPFMNDVFFQFRSGYPTFEVVLSLIESWIKNGQTIGHYNPSDLENIRRSLIESFLEIFNRICPWIYLKLKADHDLMPEAVVMDENLLWYRNFFNQVIHKDGNTTFISMNYDVLLDDVLFKMDKKDGINFTYGFDIYDVDNQDERCRENGVLLLKPHGSINLVQCPKCKRILTFKNWSPGIQTSSYACRSCGEGLNILILPPTFNKGVEDEPYASIHKKVSEEISKADEILIIGYSLPDYDLNILQAFIEGMVKNKNGATFKVEIVDNINNEKEQSKIKDKYGSIFRCAVNKIICHFEGFKKYAAG